jgi:23S rRNA pseudouridine2605 synthase
LKTPPEETQRLHVRISRSGLCSRRAAERLIVEGRVWVNGEPVAELGFKVGPGDEVSVDGETISAAKRYTLLLNKPTGVVTTLHDPQGRPTIVRYLPNYGVQLKPVGRLDMETEGLLIVTNDGELAHRLAHPRYGIEKEYQATVLGVPSDKALEELSKGVYIDGRKTHPAQVRLVHANPSKGVAVLNITIHEGRYRQVRLMCDSIGHPVQALKRLRLGPFTVKGMRPGEARLLGVKEVDGLRRLVGLA